MKKEKTIKKREKIMISVCAVLMYVLAVIVCCTFLKPQQYEESNMQRSRHIAEEITYKGLKDLNINTIEIKSIDNKIDFNTIFEKGLIYTNYEDISLDLKLDDVQVRFEKGIFSFEFFELTVREQLAIDLGLSYKVSYKISVDDLLEYTNYSKVTYIFLVLFLYPFCILIMLCGLVVNLVLFGVLCILCIDKIKEKKKGNTERKIKKEESDLNFKLTNSCADKRKKEDK